MKCPSCGHENDPGNRFCEYCGARLDPSVIQEPTIAGPPPFAESDSSYDAPTMFVPSAEQPAPQETPSAEAAPSAEATPSSEAPAQATEQPVASSTPTVTCHVCGFENNATDRFCEQCGAALQDAAQTASPQPDAQEEATVEAPPPVSLHGDPRGHTEEETPLSESEPTINEELEPTSEPVATGLEESAPIQAPTAEANDVLAPSATAKTDTSDAERERLVAAIQEHRDNLSMFEQMAARYEGRDMPQHIQTGLEESQRSITTAEQQLADYDAARSATALPDPAEVARLETAIQEHRDNLSMFEQMAARYEGRDMPQHIQTGLEESRRAMEQAQADLDALRGDGTSPSAAPDQAQSAASATEPEAAAPMPTSEPAEAAAPMPTEAPTAQAETPVVETQAPAPEQSTPVAEPVVAPPAEQPKQPHFVVEASGKELVLPTDKTEIMIGREDPISGIFPDIDLTKHGGETGGVSREHAKVHHSGDSWSLEDLNSTNYTRINGTKVEPGTPQPLNNGDKVSVGRVTLIFHA